jgi:hypothetical protein
VFPSGFFTPELLQILDQRNTRRNPVGREIGDRPPILPEEKEMKDGINQSTQG